MILAKPLWKIIHFLGVPCAAAALLISCQSVHRGLEKEIPAEEIRYQLIYVIHGDGSYLYHTRDGKANQADLRALEQAFDTAAALTHAEVFVFHQKSKKRFVSNTGNFYYFKNGVRKNEFSYERRHTPSFWEEEAAIFHTYHAGSDSNAKIALKPLRIFLFFGHQVFETDGLGYYSSYPDETFGVDELARGIALFGAQGETLSSNSWAYQKKDTFLNLIVLSTCRGGTPGTIKKLSPLTRYIIASPENLHLSYMNMGILKDLETWNGNTMQPFYRDLVVHAFTDLIQLTNTVVSIALYDTGQVGPYLESIEEQHERRLITYLEEGAIPLDYFDCQDDPVFSREFFGKGVFILYRPPLFGRDKMKNYHSGWECWR
jgi:hypothetical protein